MGGPRGRKGAKVDPAKMDQYKEVCPPHKLKDLDALVKSLKGKDAEILAKIQEWWEEPQIVEPEWENVDKKNKKKQQQQQQQQRDSGRGGRGPGGRGGRSYRGGGRGGGSERRSRGGDRRRSPPPQEEQSKVEPQNNDHDAPSPVKTAPAPKGAWGQRAAAAAPPTPEPVAPVPLSPVKTVTPLKPQVPEPVVDVGVVVPQDPTPSGMNGSSSAATTPSKPGGNVWATKGSAHLIQKEKPKPPPPPPTVPQMRMAPPTAEPPKSPVKQTIEPDMTLESGLPSTLSGGSWNNATSAASIEITQSSASVTDATIGSMAPEPPVVQEPPGSPPKPTPAAPAPMNVLNMGHWESGEGDDSQNLDFGFGSFGPESDAPEEPSTPLQPAKETTATVSPARPPPGLSIGGGGMPPMPANAVLVHELEGKLENTSLKTEEQSAPKPMASNLPSQPPPPPGQPGGAPSAPPGVSQNYNAAYGGMGMYNYNNAGASGFMGQQGAPGLGGPPQQKPVPQQTPAGAPQHLQQAPPGGLYGTAASSSGVAPGDSSTAPSSTETSTTAGIPPPGMPNAMPYNPALFYGQQPYQAMGQPHGGVAGYGYGYGTQFGAAGGFYGQQVMGQSGGYPSAYDDQPPQGRDYPSKGRNSYRNSGNQYAQNQFQPQQHGGYGYGGQPMGGYNVDHFNQARGGYGHGPPTDAHGYGMPQQQGSSNYEGKKGGRFQQQQQQQQQPQQLGGSSGGHGQQQQPQQNAPFLGGNNNTSSSNNQGGGGGASAGGWPNNNNSNNNQGGGWGQPSAWQGGN